MLGRWSKFMDAGREFLEGQVREAEGKRATAAHILTEAIERFEACTSDLLAFQKALEAYTRGKDNPYHPPLLVSPLDSRLGAVPPAQSPVKHKDVRPSEKRITKRSIILKTLAAQNGKGLKVRGVYAALPKDAPIEITLEDLYRALPSLKKHDKIWQDTSGRYYLGPKPANAGDLAEQMTDGLNELFEDKEEALVGNG